MKCILLVLITVSVQATPFLDEKDMKKIKDLVDQELLKREIDMYVKERMEKAERGMNTYARAQSFFEQQMQKLKPDSKQKISQQLEQVAATSPPTIATTTTEMSNKVVEEVQEVIAVMETDDCHDIYVTDKCIILRDSFNMCDKDRLTEMCAETCGACIKKAHSPVDCSKATFGCCLDGVHAKADPKGTNCGCRDNVAELCIGNEQDCNSLEFVGNWMRKNCKKTCELCTPFVVEHCIDDPEQEAFCPSWKQEGLCQTIPKLMEKHCQRTCGMCLV